MSARAPPLLSTLLRSSTSTLRPASTQLPWTLPQFQQQRRTPSPPPPYQARNISLLASTSQWTRFSTTHTHSSIRTFTRSTTKRPFASAATSSSPSQPASSTDSSSAESPSTDASPSPSSSTSVAQAIDSAIEEITELYGTARDEFEIAAEETEKNTTYAPDDRAAAREELDRLLAYYEGVLQGGDGAVAEEVKRRVGQRIRELEQAVVALEESAAHGD